MAATCGNCKAEGVDVAHVRTCYGFAVDTAGLPVKTDAPPRVVKFRVGEPAHKAEVIAADERLYLYVPYEEKDDAKKFFGAKFDGTRRQWYVSKEIDLSDLPKSWLEAPGAPPVLEDGIYFLNDKYFMLYESQNGHKLVKVLQLSYEETQKMQARDPEDEEVLEDALGRWEYAGSPLKHGLKPEHRLDDEAAAKFGSIYGWCGICGRTLTNEESKKRGIGPICAEKNGL